MYCTSEGSIGVLRDAAAGAGRLLFQEPTAAVRACCLGAAGPCTQLFCATDQEGLVFRAVTPWPLPWLTCKPWLMLGAVLVFTD